MEFNALLPPPPIPITLILAKLVVCGFISILIYTGILANTKCFCKLGQKGFYKVKEFGNKLIIELNIAHSR
jgi:hypothetical protein